LYLTCRHTTCQSQRSCAKKCYHISSEGIGKTCVERQRVAWNC
jgi:hypothetical protein